MTRASDIAGWLTGELAPSGLMETTFDGTAYPDYGLTADVVLALRSVGDASAPTVAAALTTPDATTAYTGDGTSVVYAGATAKLAATLVAVGQDPHDVAGRDLLAQLLSTQQPSGRLSDLGGDDYSQTVSQAWGALALEVGDDDGAPAPVVDYLLAQQCDDGGFRAQLDVEPCVSDVDATAFAVSALVAGDHAAARDAAAAAGAWLDAQRQSDAAGAFWSSGEPPQPNVNSTAVASAALCDLMTCDSSAQAWIAASGEGAEGALQLAGADDARTSAQGVVALAGAGLAGLFD